MRVSEKYPSEIRVPVDNEMWDWIDEEADITDRTKSSVIREVLRSVMGGKCYHKDSHNCVFGGGK